MEDLDRPRRLADVVREMKIAEADRLDAADQEGDVARRKLEALAEELSDVFEEAGGEEAGFDFQISQGAHPRLWIDAATHVAIGRDGRTYRILRDARGGRTLLGETDDLDDAADRVTRYVATRSLERERLLDDGRVPVRASGSEARPVARPLGGSLAEVERVEVRKPSRFVRFVRALIWFALGALVGAALLFVAYGERLGFENPVPGEYRRFYEPYVPPVPSDGPVVIEGESGSEVDAAEPVEETTTDGTTTDAN